MYARRVAIGVLLLAAALSFFTSRIAKPRRLPYIQGRNKTVLFLVNSEHGLTNVHVATAAALLVNYPDIEVHFASFPLLRGKLKRVSSYARVTKPAASEIIFHELKGVSYTNATEKQGKFLENIPHPPAAAGIGHFTKDIQVWISPWSAKDHLALYEELGVIIDSVDPAVIVLDTMFRPALDITRDQHRQHAFITPNTLVDNFLADQPYGSMLWKYPALSSGFSFPLALRKIPENVYLNARLIYSILYMPELAAKKRALKAKGLHDPINFYGMYRDDIPWITQNTEGAAIPVDYVPKNVTCAGPIVLSSAPANEQDPELAAWLKGAPTILINLGSSTRYSEDRASAFVPAVAEVLEKSHMQVLWKFTKYGEYSDDLLSLLQPYINAGRLRMSRWLTVDPVSLLETGDIVASVHHGGSNCYHEAISAGVAQVILPMWADLYNFAALVETIGLGVWGCKETSPNWTSKCLSSAILEVVGGGEPSVNRRKKAKSLGLSVQWGEKGRDIAAREVSKLAYTK